METSMEGLESSMGAFMSFHAKTSSAGDRGDARLSVLGKSFYSCSLCHFSSCRRSSASNNTKALTAVTIVITLYVNANRQTQLGNMRIDPKFVELTADVLRTFF